MPQPTITILSTARQLVVERDSRRVDAPPGRPPRSSPDGLGLLVDLLQHEVGVAAPSPPPRCRQGMCSADGRELGRRRAVVTAAGVASTTWSSSRSDRSRVDGEDGGDGRGDEGRRRRRRRPRGGTPARRDQQVGVGGEQAATNASGPSPGAGRPGRRRPGEVPVGQRLLHQVGEDLGVGLRAQSWPGASSSSPSSTWFSMIPLWTTASRAVQSA